MNIFNVFKLENMPTDSEQQNEIINQMVDVKNMHVHCENGDYYLVRKTALSDVGNVKVTKLDPKVDAELMAELVEVMIVEEEKLPAQGNDAL